MGRDGKGKVPRICQVCEKHFEIYHAWLRNGKAGKFCSKECQAKGFKRKSKIMIDAVCKECNISFSYRKGRGGTGEYCSIECRAKANGRKLGGANHPNWKGGITRRKSSVKVLIEKLKRDSAIDVIAR